MTDKLPMWARMPAHKQKVVATPRGWMVEATGEYLKLVKNLTDRLEALGIEQNNDEQDHTLEPAPTQETAQEPVKMETNTEELDEDFINEILSGEHDKTIDAGEQPKPKRPYTRRATPAKKSAKKRRGRPPKNKTE